MIIYRQGRHFDLKARPLLHEAVLRHTPNGKTLGTVWRVGPTGAGRWRAWVQGVPRIAPKWFKTRGDALDFIINKTSVTA